MTDASSTAAKGVTAQSAAASDVQVGSLPHVLGFTLRRLQLAYKRHFMRAAAGTDFQLNHLGILSLIARNPGVTPTALATALTTDAAQVTTVINLLEIRGWVSRRKSRSDSRSRSLRLTASGKRHYERLSAIAAEVERDFVGKTLSAEEHRQLLGLLDRLQASNNRA
jgi:DNA-binding MarR family transcriptional regulator